MFENIEIGTAYMLSQDNVCPLQIFYNASVKFRINTSTPDGTGKIYLFHPPDYYDAKIKKYYLCPYNKFLISFEAKTIG
jgi:hypothetical protein